MKLIVFAALICSALAANIPIPRNEHHYCTCETHLMRAGQTSENKYIPVEIKDFFKENNQCNKETIEACKKDCLKEVSKLTHGYDLLKPLSDGSHNGLILGEVICTRFLLQQFHDKQITLLAHVNCQVDEQDADGEPVYLNTAVPAGLHSDYEFSCVGLLVPHFELGKRVEGGSTTPGPQPTTQPQPPTTPQPYTTVQPTNPPTTPTDGPKPNPTTTEAPSTHAPTNVPSTHGPSTHGPSTHGPSTHGPSTTGGSTTEIPETTTP